MSKGIAITGMGIISAIGNTLSANLASLLSENPGISRLSNIESRHADSIKVGEIKSTNEAFATQLSLAQDNSYSRTTMLGLIAAQEAIAHAGISDIQAYKTGFVSASSVGGMDMTERYYYQYLESKENWRYIDAHHIGDSSEKIAQELGITAYTTSISTACSSAANAIMLGARLIKAGHLDRVIVGGADCLSKFTINGFKTLMILSETDCMPFDENRTGLNLGEAAAYLVLEADHVVAKENKKAIAYLRGYANANDAFHQTASSENGEGAALAMQKALEKAGLSAADIDYINAHGTATPNNDLSEGRAIRSLFGEDLPAISSTKAFTGHTLAAAGAIEAVYAVLAIQEQMVFPNLNFKTPIAELGIRPVSQLTEQKIDYVLSNSFGFGGNCSSLIFAKN